MERSANGTFTADAIKPVATIVQDGTHHYVLIMGTRQMGGDNIAALAKYARAQGYKLLSRGSK